MILAGGSREQLPQERILGLSGVMGNAALAELFAMRSEGLRFSEWELPRGACMTSPAAFAVSDAPALVSDAAPAGPIGNTQPMTL